MPFQIEGGDPGSIIANHRFEIPDPTVMEAKRVALQNAKNEQSLFPMRQEEMKNTLATQKLALQQSQLALDEAKIVQATLPKYRKPDGTIDYQGAMGELAGRVRQSTLQGMQTFLDAHTKSKSEADHYAAETQKLQLEAQQKHKLHQSEMAARLLADYTPANVHAALSLADTPEEQKQAQALLAQYEQDPEALKPVLENMVLPETKDAIAKRAETEAKTKESSQKLVKEKLETAARTAPDNAAEWSAWYAQLDPSVKPYVPANFSPAALDRVRKLGLTPAEVETARHNLATEANAKNNVTEAELSKIATDPTRTPEERAAADAALKRLDKSRLAGRPVVNNIIPGMPTGPLTGDAANAHGDDYLKTLPPSVAAQVRRIFTGDDAIPPANSRSQAAIQLRNAVYQAYPDFSNLTAQQRKETLREFNSTQPNRAGGQLLALNTVVHHADLYLEVADALKNGTWRAGNALYNRVAAAFGKAPPIQADLVARFLAAETGKVATGGVPAEGEINGILANLKNDGSPEQLARAGETLLGIAAGRMVPLKELRDQANLQSFVKIVGPHAAEILQRRGYDPETMRRGGGGQQSSSYKKIAVGPNGHRIGTNDGGNTWYDLQTGQKVQ